MGTGRKLNKKPATRPRKSGADKKRREAEQRKRLIALGVDAEAVRTMTSQRVRELLKRPAEVTPQSR